MDNYKIISQEQIINNKLKHLMFTIMQICAFIYTVYYVVNWYFDFWERTGVSVENTPAESVGMLGILAGVIVVSILNLFRPKHLFISYDRKKREYLSFDTYQNMAEYEKENYPRRII
jgi:hypothetical protein